MEYLEITDTFQDPGDKVMITKGLRSGRRTFKAKGTANIKTVK